MSLQYEPQAALDHLRAADAHLAAAIERCGEFAIERESEAGRTPYHSLLRAIVYQQLSGKAAGSIHDRLLALLDGAADSAPQALLALSDEQLRGAGLSRNKVLAVRDLAARCLDGTVPGDEALQSLDDEQIIERLSRVRGVGRWTVEMLLIFKLGRPDVLPVGDLGVRRGCQWLFGMAEPPTPKALTALAEPWRPYRSVASWYLWRISDGDQAQW